MFCHISKSVINGFFGTMVENLPKWVLLFNYNQTIILKNKILQSIIVKKWCFVGNHYQSWANGFE